MKKLNIGKSKSTSMEQAEERLKQWDNLIRGGQARLVRDHCKKINHKQIPRQVLVEYCQIARRVGAPELIVRWLQPAVRVKKDATESEKALYALGLFRLGAFREAEQLLGECHAEKEPQIFFYRASLYINQWNYQRAIPELRKYIRNPKVPEYSKLVGRLNLCASLVGNQDFNQAELEIEKLLKRIGSQEYSLLRGNLLEIRSQLFVEKQKFDKALQDLTDAGGLLKNADERSLVYVDKWKSIIHLKKYPPPKTNFQIFDSIRERAVQIQDWETIREIDLSWSLAAHDRDLFLRVYWGSRFNHYKDRVKKLFNDSRHIEDQFIWKNSPEEQSESAVDLVEMAPTKLLKRFFFILTRDFYRPLRSTELIDYIYENEFFNPISSPVKLHRLLLRARAWISEVELPVVIEVKKNSFRIKAHTPLRLQSHLGESERVFKLPSEFTQRFFTAAEWAQLFGISDRSARRQLSGLVREGVLVRKGHGRRIKYGSGHSSGPVLG